jgi:hypothetical protein
MPEGLHLARPIMRRRAGLDAHQTGRQLLEEREHVPALQLPADDDATLRVDAMNLKAMSSPIVVIACIMSSPGSWSPHRQPIPRRLRAAWEEPSTASGAVICKTTGTVCIADAIAHGRCMELLWQHRREVAC